MVFGELIIYFQLICLKLLMHESQAEIYSATAHVRRLLITEEEMIRTMGNYITIREKRLQDLKLDLLEKEKVHGLVSESPDSFVENPVNAYFLIRRVSKDWINLQDVLSRDSVGQTLLSNLTNMADTIDFPTESDVDGVISALMRLQDTYKLETSHLAHGIVKGLKAYRQLTIEESYEIGQHNYDMGNFRNTRLWMEEALKRHPKELTHAVNRFDILEFLAYSTYKEGNILQALKLTNDLLKEKPDHTKGLHNKIYYEKIINEQKSEKREETSNLPIINDTINKDITDKENSDFLDSEDIEMQNYERLCRGEGKMSPDMKRKLICFYQTGPSAWLRLARVKVEVVHIDPTIVMYHEVLYDSEIESIKQLATPRLKRALIQYSASDGQQVASYRVSKSAWFPSNESPHITNVNRRIELITGLNLLTAEMMQVGNYGIGGHYESHHDHWDEDDDSINNDKFGNRIATFMYYLTDVKAGGCTVFTNLELTIVPRKGSAAFWYNLHPSGKGDELTLHAGCPVLVGQKWVINKWIHEHGQVFRKPCSLNFEDTWGMSNFM